MALPTRSARQVGRLAPQLPSRQRSIAALPVCSGERAGYQPKRSRVLLVLAEDHRLHVRRRVPVEGSLGEQQRLGRKRCQPRQRAFVA